MAGSRGFYQISALIDPARHIKYIWIIIEITILLLISFMFILKVGDKYSRGSIVVFAAFALGLATFGRLTLARISTIGVQNEVIAGRRAVAVGAASELDKILPYDLRRFGIEEVARVGLIQSDETMGLGKEGARRLAMRSILHGISRHRIRPHHPLGSGSASSGSGRFAARLAVVGQAPAGLND